MVNVRGAFCAEAFSYFNKHHIVDLLGQVQLGIRLREVIALDDSFAVLGKDLFIACGSVLFLWETDGTVKAVCKLKPVFAADIYPFVLRVKLYMPVFFETHIVIDKSLGVAGIRAWV